MFKLNRFFTRRSLSSVRKFCTMNQQLHNFNQKPQMEKYKGWAATKYILKKGFNSGIFNPINTCINISNFIEKRKPTVKSFSLISSYTLISSMDTSNFSSLDTFIYYAATGVAIIFYCVFLFFGLLFLSWISIWFMLIFTIIFTCLICEIFVVPAFKFLVFQ